MSLDMITNRGVKVYPNGFPETFCTNHWRCRWLSKDEKPLDYKAILALQTKVNQAGFDVIKTENLCKFDGERQFSAGQGQG